MNSFITLGPGKANSSSKPGSFINQKYQTRQIMPAREVFCESVNDNQNVSNNIDFWNQHHTNFLQPNKLCSRVS